MTLGADSVNQCYRIDPSSVNCPNGRFQIGGYFSSTRTLCRRPLRTDGRALAWVRLSDVTELKSTLKICRRHKLRWMFHWPQESWMTKGDWKRVIIRLAGTFSKIKVEDGQLHIGAAALWGELAAFPNWGRDFKHWPGSIGALFHRGQGRLIKGYPGQIQYYYDRKVHSQDWGPREDPPDLPKSAIPLKLILSSGRRRRRQHLLLGMVLGASLSRRCF